MRLSKLLLLLILYQTSFSQTTIFQAARENNTAFVTQYISDGFNIDTVDSRGFSPLILACYNGNKETTHLLIKAGASIDLQDRTGNTALIAVCFKGFSDLFDLLFTSKIDVDKQNFNGATALTFAATFNQVVLVKKLKEKGARSDIKDRFGKTPLDYALIQDNIEVINILSK